MIRGALTPTERAASIYGMRTTASPLARTTRATRGMTGSVMATMTFRVPGPRAATTAMAMTMSGNEMRMSMIRWMISSVLPPKYAPRTPNSRPRVDPTSDDENPTRSAVWDP